jgi:hypothetical protein
MVVGRGNQYHNKAFQSYQQSGIQQKQTPATGELVPACTITPLQLQ